MKVIEKHESAVRSYCRTFPATFDRAEGSELHDSEGRRYLDFFSGAGALNYGHNHPDLVEALVDYLRSSGVVHSLDMATRAKEDFLEQFSSVILEPRGLRYRVQFPGPTGTNAVEAALKLARKVTGRTNVLAFTNGFHGMTLGALACTSNRAKRDGAGVPLPHVTRAPYAGHLGDGTDTIDWLESTVFAPGGGIDPPAAAIVETVQGEGGLQSASAGWLRRLTGLLHRHGSLLIVDDIQAGCGRTGPFFSFEPADLEPDIVCLSKSISGLGLPMALTLIRPDLDAWEPGEHNGTFRGHNPAFVTARAALEFWLDDRLERDVARKGRTVDAELSSLAEGAGPTAGTTRGRGLFRGIAFEDDGLAARVSAECFRRGLILETAGPSDEVLKVMPPLVISDDELEEGLAILRDSMEAAQATATSASRVAS